VAFSYATTHNDKMGKVKKVGGTWSSAGVTTGVISFGPINGFQINALVDANVVTSSTANTTNTAWKLVPGTATTQAVISITAAVSNDSGYWSAEYI
jgi:hypothetical protein